MRHSFFYFYLLLTVAAFSVVEAHTVFVSPAGDDANDGSFGKPYKTLSFATSHIAAGDTLYVRGGTYTEEVFLEQGGDGFSGPTLIAAYPGEQCTVQNVDYGGTAFSILRGKYTVKGLEIMHANIGINIDLHFGVITGFVIVDSCIIHDVGYGISVGPGHDIAITNCQMYNFGYAGLLLDAGKTDSLVNIRIDSCNAHDADYTIPVHDGHLNALGFSLRSFHSRNVTLTDCQSSRVGSGFNFEGDGVRVLNCSAAYCDNAGGGGFVCKGDSIFLINCLSFGHANSGFNLRQETGDTNAFTGKQTSTFIFNCTGVNNNRANILVNDTLKKLYLYNTLLAGGDTETGADTADASAMQFTTVSSNGWPRNYIGDYNIFESINATRLIDLPKISFGTITDQASPPTMWQDSSLQDAHSKFLATSDNLLVNILQNDFRPAPGSPAINAGTSVYSYPTDITGRARNTNPTIGCYEFSGIGGVATLLPVVPVLHVYPNPAHQQFSIALPAGEFQRIAILDLSGKIIREISAPEISINGNQLSISTAGLARGVYLCEVVGVRTMLTGVVVVE